LLFHQNKRHTQSCFLSAKTAQLLLYSSVNNKVPNNNIKEAKDAYILILQNSVHIVGIYTRAQIGAQLANLVVVKRIA